MNRYPDEEHDWLTEDYLSYWRHFEQEQDTGNIAPDQRMLSFDEWLSSQPASYREAHQVKEIG